MKTHFNEHEYLEEIEREHQKGIPTEAEPKQEIEPKIPGRFTLKGLTFFGVVVAGLWVLGQFILPFFPEEYIEILIYAYLYFAMGFDPTTWFDKKK